MLSARKEMCVANGELRALCCSVGVVNGELRALCCSMGVANGELRAHATCVALLYCGAPVAKCALRGVRYVDHVTIHSLRKARYPLCVQQTSVVTCLVLYLPTPHW